MRMTKKTKAVIAIIIAVIFLLACALPILNGFNVSAMTGSQKTQQELNGVMQKQKVTAEDLKKRTFDLKNMYDDKNKTDAKLEELERQQEGNLKAQEEANTELTASKDTFNNRLQFIYEHGNAGYIEILFQAKNISDFFHRYELISQLIDYDKKVIDKVTEAKKKRDEAVAATEQNIKEQKEQQAIQAEQTKKAENIQQEVKELNEKLLDNIEELEKKVEDEKRQEEAIARQIAASSRSSSVVFKDGKFSWPIPGYSNITSPYGYREHPTLKVNKLHTGVDIGAPTGTPVYAAASGVVMMAGYNSAYGNYVVIDHGGGYSTLYGHASKLCVTKGQSVSKGDLILKVGSTGYSTGAHLHFEVLLNGKTTNPMSYF